MGDEQATERLKEVLSHASPEELGKLDVRHFQSTVELIWKTDHAWVGAWVIDNLLTGAIRPEEWMHMVPGIPSALRDQLLNQVCSEDLTGKKAPGVIPLLRRFADVEIVRRLFRRMCELSSIVATSRPGDTKQSQRQ